MFWCANADFVERADEIDFILTKVEPGTYERMHREFHGDNDSQRIDKIVAIL